MEICLFYLILLSCCILSIIVSCITISVQNKRESFKPIYKNDYYYGAEIGGLEIKSKLNLNCDMNFVNKRDLNNCNTINDIEQIENNNKDNPVVLSNILLKNRDIKMKSLEYNGKEIDINKTNIKNINSNYLTATNITSDSLSFDTLTNLDYLKTINLETDNIQCKKITISSSETEEDKSEILRKIFIDIAYPVGSYITCYADENPTEFFNHGTWTRIYDYKMVNTFERVK